MDPSVQGKFQNDKTHSGNSISYPCGICGKKFPFNFHLQRHIISHHPVVKSSPKRISPQEEPSTPSKRSGSRQSTAATQCEFCGKRFNFLLFLREHIASVHPNGPRKADTRRALQSGVTHDCAHCGKSFTFNSQLRDHIASAHGEEFVPAPALILPIQVVPEEQMKTPLYKSSEENICKTCGNTFSTVYNLQRHMKNLHNVDSVLVRTGESGNTGRSYLETLTDKVSSPAPASATKVPKRGRAASNKASKPVPPVTPKVQIPVPDVITYACAQCDKVFVFKNSLLDHISREHSTEPDKSNDDAEIQTPLRVTDEGRSCEACAKQFSNHFNLIRHLRNVHHADAVLDSSTTMKVINIVGTLPYVEPAIAIKLENVERECGVAIPSHSDLGDHIASVHVEKNLVVKRSPVIQMGISVSDEQMTAPIAENGEDTPDNEQGSIASTPNSQPEDKIANTSGTEITATSLGDEIETPLPPKVVKNSCAICSNAFASYQNLLRHLRNIHHVNFVRSAPGRRRTSTKPQSEGDNNCTHCGRSFASTGRLRHHILNVHTTKFTTDETEQTPVVKGHETFPCHVCHGAFCSFHNLLRHLRNVHKIIGLRDRDSYARLTNTPLRQKPPTLFSCRFCDKQFKLNFVLRRHVASVHPDVPLVPENLDPNATHTGPMRLACDLCGETFKLNFHLRRHIATAHASAHFCLMSGKKPGSQKIIKKVTDTPQCVQCGKQFKLNIQLRRHLKTEHNKSPGTGNAEENKNAGPTSDKEVDFDDDKGYVNNKENEDAKYTPVHRQTSVKSATSITKKVKRASCKFCSATFKLNVQLRRHIRTEHPSEKPLCEPCGKRFSSHLCYVRHINTVHRADRKPAVCEFCGKHFSQRYNLKVHMEIHTRHGKPPSCHICGKSFSSNICYQRHLKMMHTNRPPVFCEVCGKSFTQKNNLKVHMESHTRHLIRIIEAGEEVELPEPPAAQEIDLDRGLRGHRQLVGNGDLETVEAITLELPVASDADSSDEEPRRVLNGEDPEAINLSPPTVDRQHETDGRLDRWRRKELHRKFLMKRRELKKNKETDNSLMSTITNWMVERETDSMAVVRRQHPVFMRKAIDLSQPAADINSSHRSTAAVYTTYMLA